MFSRQAPATNHPAAVGCDFRGWQLQVRWRLGGYRCSGGVAQAWLRLQGYQPTVLHLGPLTRLGARVSRAQVAFDDHPAEQRFSDRIATVTVDSVLTWLPRAGLAGASLRATWP